MLKEVENTWRISDHNILTARHLTRDSHPSSLSDRIYDYIAFVAKMYTMGSEWENPVKSHVLI